MLATPTINEEEIRHSDYLEPGTEITAKGLITLTFTARYYPKIKKSDEGAVRTDRSERELGAKTSGCCKRSVSHTQHTGSGKDGLFC
jgi:hypothetical protein